MTIPTKPSNQRLQREKLLLRYTGALERGDAEIVAAVLHHAESDPDLARMIDEINAVYAAEDGAITQLTHQPSTNGHHTKESPMTVIARPTISTHPITRRALPLTLVATLAALLIIGSAMFSALTPRESGTPAALQSTATAAPIAQPLRYYMETLSDIFYDLNGERTYRDYYAYIWFEAPNKYRLESYTAKISPPAPYQNRVADLALSTPRDISQLTLHDQNPFTISLVMANNGEYSWWLGGLDPAPQSQDPRLRTPLGVSIGIKQIAATSLEDLLAQFQQQYGDVRQLEDETLLGRPVYVFETAPAPAYIYLPSEAARVVVKVDQETLVQLAVTAFDADGKQVYNAEAVKFDPNPTIHPATFTFNLPEELPATFLPDHRARNLRAMWATYATKADFDVYGLLSDEVFTQKHLLPGEFYLDQFGRSSLQYYHAADALFDNPALAIWLGRTSAADADNTSGGIFREMSPTDFIRKVDINGVSGTLVEAKNFPLVHEPYTTLLKEGYDYYQLQWQVHDTVIVMFADKSKVSEQDIIDLASMLTYIPLMPSAAEMTTAWQFLADSYNSALGLKVYKPALFNERVSDTIQTGGLYNGSPNNVFLNDPDSDNAARSAYNKLIPEPPTHFWRDAGIVQRFHSAERPGIVLTITQGDSRIIPTEVSIASRDEEFEYYGFKGIYRVETVNTMQRANTQPENIHTIITQLNGTTIVLQAPLESLTKAEMLAILPTLTEVTPTPKTP
jgi:outer membrane lipoprotein-sorting protein